LPFYSGYEQLMLNKKQVDFFTSKEKNCKLEHHHYFDEKTKFIYMSILIADSGSTKTDWVLLKNNNIIIQFQTIGFNPYFQSSEDIHNEIKTVLLPVLKDQLQSISQIAYYGAGCSTTDKVQVVKQGLYLAFGNIPSEINHDLLAAARALCGKEKGIACILGTGSNSCLYDGVEVTENVPSVGYLFGDHGSGATIGKIFVQHYFDKKLPLHLITAFENAGYHREIILESVYKKPMPSKYLANIVKFLSNYNNDSFVKDLIKNCFLDFFDAQVSKYTNAKALHVNFVGSIGFYYKDLLVDAAKEKGFIIGNIIKSPIDGLIKYHS
jgi:N-acetylglucosamine kinase-like BadF-type ATPase